MEGLLASHPWPFGEDKVWFGFGLGDDRKFTLRVEFGATFCGGDALKAAGMGEFSAIGDKPAFAVS